MDSLEAGDRAAAAVAVAPRVTLDGMKEKIGFIHYINAGEASRALSGMKAGEAPASLDLLTLCIIVMHNGFTIVGKSAPASAANYNAELGRTFAYEDAIRQLWPLEGYALRERLASGAA